MEYRLSTPLTREALAPLRAGDTVRLSGVVYTARDAAHGRMEDLLKEGKSLPFPIEGTAIYYVGPTPERPGQVIGAAGPTTAGRMDRFTPRLLDLGLACDRQRQAGRSGQAGGCAQRCSLFGGNWRRRCADGRKH